MAIRALRRLTIPVLALAAAQAGHLVSYNLRYGGAAASVQAGGAHAYFPSLLSAVEAAAGSLLVGALLIVGAARALRGRRGLRSRPAPGRSFVELVAIFFALQVAIYCTQETLEALAAGSPAPQALSLLLWGTLGQLPLAVVAAIALRWLGSRVETALQDLSLAWHERAASPEAPAGAVVFWTEPAPAFLMAAVAGSGTGRRGPPSTS